MPYLDDLLKNLAIGGSNVATGLAGQPANLASLITSGGQWLGNKLNPEDTGTQNTLEGLKNIFSYATPEALQGYAEKATGGYLKPKTPVQKVVSEYSSDIGSALGGGPIKKALTTGVKLATAGNAAKQIAKLFGVKEEDADLFKLGGMLGAGGIIKSTKNIPTMAHQIYEFGKQTLEPAKRANVKNLIPIAKKALKEASYGVGKTEAVNFIEKFLKKTKNGTMTARDLWEFEKDAYTIKDTEAIQHIKPFKKAITESLHEYGNKFNQPFGIAHKNADVLWSINKGKPFIDKVINKVLGQGNDKLSEFATKAILYGEAGLKGLLTKGAIGSMAKRGEAFLRSPLYRKEATKLAVATAKQNTGMATKALESLIKVQNESEPHIKTKSGKIYKITPAVQQQTQAKKINHKPYKILSPEETRKYIQENIAQT